MNLSDLAALEVGDFNLTPHHLDFRAVRGHGDPELRALHDRREVGRLDFEMLNIALLDFEKD